MFENKRGVLMLKILNILGYISLLSLFVFLLILAFYFDLFLKILNTIYILILIIMNFIFFKKKKYLGIRFFIIIITLFILSFTTYYIYINLRAYIFKNKINQIYDEERNVILTSQELSSYKVKYIPDKNILDDLSKGGGHRGYIEFKNSDEEKNILYTTIYSSCDTHLIHYLILYNSNRYYLN